MITMFKNQKGFGFIELAIASAASIVILVAVYNYWMKGITKMKDTITFTELRQNARKIFKGIKDDIKFAGYDPLNRKDSGNPYGFFTRSSATDPLTHMHFSYYNPKYPLCPHTADVNNCFVKIAPDPLKPETLERTFFDTNTDNTNAYMLIKNSCIRFIYWNNQNNAPCSDQMTKPCSNTMKVVFAVKPESFSEKTFNISGCTYDLATYASPCCEIIGGDMNDYIRFEEKVNMKNLHLE